MRWLEWILNFFFGCIHRHTTWPHRNREGFDYVCCLDCGAELPYSLQCMTIVSHEEQLQEQNGLPGRQLVTLGRHEVPALNLPKL
jgi:hypothetical protein